MQYDGLAAERLHGYARWEFLTGPCITNDLWSLDWSLGTRRDGEVRFVCAGDESLERPFRYSTLVQVATGVASGEGAAARRRLGVPFAPLQRPRAARVSISSAESSSEPSSLSLAPSSLLDPPAPPPPPRATTTCGPANSAAATDAVCSAPSLTREVARDPDFSPSPLPPPDGDRVGDRAGSGARVRKPSSVTASRPARGLCCCGLCCTWLEPFVAEARV